MFGAHRKSTEGDCRRPTIQSLESRALFDGHGFEAPGAHLLPAFAGEAINVDRPDPRAVYSLGSVPQLSSRPQAPAKVFLQFAGAAPIQWGPYTVPATPAYDLDGDAGTFSQSEMDGIREIWQRVSEKYSPFNVNVTTVDPGAYEYYETVRVVVGGDGAWSGGLYGGYGYVNGFSGATSNTAWVFAKNLGKGRPAYVAEAAAHEAGHNFGLQHQSSYNGTVKTEEYNRGTPEVAPIMGFSYLAARGKWWVGPTYSPFVTQSDLNVIGGPMNGFGFRADDFGNTAALATWLEQLPDGEVSGDGVIERVTDVDYFKFTTPGGEVNLAADVAPFGAMLDLSLRLLNSQGVTLDLQDTGSLGERIVRVLDPGEYFVAVASHGAYGDVGQYSISGSVVPEPAAIVVAAIFGIGWLRQKRESRAGRP